MLQPVNRLPPEILSQVARHVPNWSDHNAGPIVPLTHVCRYWRESIVSTPENWTLISSSCEHVAALSLERAKAAPLVIWLSMESVMRNPRIPDIITPYFQNVATLAVPSIPTFGEFTKRFPSFPRSMPNLRSLTLGVDNKEEWDLSIDPFESLSHNLRCLELIKIPLYPSFLPLKTLTRLTLIDWRFSLNLDTLLNFLEGNVSLESVKLWIRFVKPSLRNSRRRAAIGNRLLYLSITFRDVMDARALITNIPLRKGAHLDIFSIGGTRLKEILFGISTTHFPNLPSPTFMQYRPSMESVRLHRMKSVQLHGPNGTFSFRRHNSTAEPFADFIEFPLIALTSVRELRIIDFGRVGFPLPSLPALETLTIQTYAGVLDVLSDLLSNPSSSPSLKTLAFLNCHLSEDFMEELTRFASNRKNISTSAWLHRVLIVHWDGRFPSTGSIQRLRSYVTIVDVRMGDSEVPEDSEIERYLTG